MKPIAWLTPFLFLLSALVRADYVRIEENHPSVTYTGNWRAYTGATLSGGRLVAGDVGATVTGPVTSGVSFYAQAGNGYVNFLGTDTTANRAAVTVQH